MPPYTMQLQTRDTNHKMERNDKAGLTKEGYNKNPPS